MNGILERAAELFNFCRVNLEYEFEEDQILTKDANFWGYSGFTVQFVS